MIPIDSPPIGLISRPPSAAQSPRPSSKQRNAINKYDSAFAFRLECALWTIIAKDEANAKAGKGREAILKHRSEQQLSYDAWGSPNGWADDSSTANSSIPGSPSDQASSMTSHDDMMMIGPDHFSPPERASTSTSLSDHEASTYLYPDLSCLYQSSRPIKRKISGDDDVERSSKRSRLGAHGSIRKISLPVKELTPPSTPCSGDEGGDGVPKKIGKDAKRKIRRFGCGFTGLKALPSRFGPRTLSPQRRSKRLQQLPP